MGDWNCDGIDTIGMYKRFWGGPYAYLRNSNDGGGPFTHWNSFFGRSDDIRPALGFDVQGDVPLAGDWNGDGCDTLGIYRDGRVLLANDFEAGSAEVDYWFGISGDQPFTGDFDNDGVTDLGVFRPSTGKVYLRFELTTGIADHEFAFGLAGDTIIAGDWDNDGSDTVGAWRPSEEISIFAPSRGTLYLANTNDNVAPDLILTDTVGLPVAGNFY